MNKLDRFWKDLELKNTQPRDIRKIQIIENSKLEGIILKNESIEINNMIDNLYSGDFYIIKNAINKNFLHSLKNILMNFSKNEPSSFHKLNENCPNFHRLIDEKLALNYSLKAVRHSFYFFRWNNDEFDLFNKFDNIWSNIKFLGGLNRESYSRNTPKDGIIDRIQAVKYSENTGYVENHKHDPFNQRLIISIYMSKKNVDFISGGTYFYKDNKKIEVENQIDVGDCGIFYATLKHSVEAVTLKNNELEANDISGRWWIGLYSPESDCVTNRHTSSPSK